MKGAEQLARPGRLLARRGPGKASGETRARGQRAPFLQACGLQASVGGEVSACAAAPAATAPS